MAEYAVCTGGYTVVFSSTLHCEFYTVLMQKMKGVCIRACTHERAEPTQPYESSAAPAEHRKKICFGFQEDVTGKEYWHPFKGCRAHISSQLYNAFILLADLKYFVPLPHHVWRDSIDPRLPSRSPGLLSQVELPTLLPGPAAVPTTACFDLRHGTVQRPCAEQWCCIRSCGFMLHSSNAFSSQDWWETKQEMIMVKNMPLTKTPLLCG